MAAKKSKSTSKTTQSNSVSRPQAKPKSTRAPRQVWLVLRDDRKDVYEAYVSLTSASTSAPSNSTVVGPFVLAERNRQD